MRPPIALFTNSINGVGREGLSLVGQNAIGVELESPETSLLVSSMKNSTLTFDLIPASVKGSAEYSELKNASLLNFKAEQAATDLQTAEPTSEKLEEVRPTVKKLTINCVKGKKVIKVSSAKPKCPTGYRKK